MSIDDVLDTGSTHEPAATRGGWTRTQAVHTLRWFWWTAAAFPVAVLSHELAHYLGYRGFGFAGSALHYGSASFAAGDPFWKHMREGDIIAATRLLPPW